MKRILILLLVLSVVGINAQTVKLKIIETTDVHGSVFPYDFKNDKEKNGSLAQVHTYVNEERAKEDQHVLLIDNGDILQGTPLVYYYNFEKTDVPHVYADVMNYMKYDVGTVGNHDIETGHPVYDKFRTEIDFPWLAANAIDTKTGKPYFEPYKILEVEGIKIAVIGLITPHIPNWLPEKIWEGIEFEDMIETAKKYVDLIKQNENPDLVIGLFHSGGDYNYNEQDADTYKNENASQLIAKRVIGFDIIYVGHDHKIWNKKVENSDGDSVLFLGASSSARNTAVANVLLTKENNNWVSECSGKIVEMSNYKPDSVFVEKFKNSFKTVREYVNKPIGKLTKDISTIDAILGPSEFVDLIHTIQLELTKADVSFSAPLSFNTTLNKGDIYVRDMFKLYKYENLLYTMELTGKEIKDYLEYTYFLWFSKMNNADDHLLKYVKDENGEIKYSERSKAPMLDARFYNFDCAAGIDYTVDLSKEPGKRVSIISLSTGKPFDENVKYKVALNSYRGNGGGGHLIKGAGIPHEELSKRIITSTEKDLRYFMMEWIKDKGVVNPALLNNWKVIPEDWYKKAREKDYKILFE
ncbi:MAG: bifunctional metallophosphatase/5'-nucleotidase [Melioribacteraceae bacterium]|nr:bifunctional metallophosphatase/5'-nucleotidase [Melioribacteraceae bacterium]